MFNNYHRLALTVLLASSVSHTVALSDRGTGGLRGTSSDNSSNEGNEYDLRWAVPGGGWRAMSAGAAYANVFVQAGLIGPNSSEFSAISSNSGGTWFSTQFFYSDKFFDNVIGDASGLESFIEEWMHSYGRFVGDFKYDSTLCDLLRLTDDPLMEEAAAACAMLIKFDGSWADYIEGMLRDVSTKLYDDSGFVDRQTLPSNRVSPLSNTDLLIQTTMNPSSITLDDPSDPLRSSKTISYFGPGGQTEDEFYSTVFAVLYAVKNNSTLYEYGLEEEQLPLKVGWSRAPQFYDSDEWASYGSYGEQGELLINPLWTLEGQGKASEFFGGSTPTTAQIASASSAAAGAASQSVPSTLSQVFDKLKASTKDPTKQAELELAESIVYSTPISRGVAVCSQWPQECAEQDAEFIDGAYIDNNAFTMNIADYQQSSAGSGKTLKIILTAPNNAVDNDDGFLVYFDSPVNTGVKPGQWIWTNSYNPIRSVQVFEDKLDNDKLEKITLPVKNSNITTAIIEATTVDNPSYGIKSGQKVQVLYIRTNSNNIPTILIEEQDIKKWTPEIGSMVDDITMVANEELIKRINEFLSV